MSTDSKFAEARNASSGCAVPSVRKNGDTMVTDPVCGMHVDEKSAAASATFSGQRYYFCCSGCRDKFVADPASFLDKTEADATSADRIYRCPMHPDVQQHAPGKCSKCGMALEAKHVPKAPSLPLQDSTSAARGGQYTCPMHPQIVRDGPGDCPICGMALVPIAGTGDAD